MDRLMGLQKMVFWLFMVLAGFTGYQAYDLYFPEHYDAMTIMFSFSLFLVSAAYAGIIIKQHERQKQLTDQLTTLINHQLKHEKLMQTISKVGIKENV